MPSDPTILRMIGNDQGHLHMALIFIFIFVYIFIIIFIWHYGEVAMGVCAVASRGSKVDNASYIFHFISKEGTKKEVALKNAGL